MFPALSTLSITLPLYFPTPAEGNLLLTFFFFFFFFFARLPVIRGSPSLGSQDQEGKELVGGNRKGERKEARGTPL